MLGSTVRNNAPPLDPDYAGNPDGRLYLLEGIETIDGCRVTSCRVGLAFLHGREEAEAQASELRRRGWLSVRCVLWEG